jgi:hypothetical protein
MLKVAAFPYFPVQVSQSRISSVIAAFEAGTHWQSVLIEIGGSGVVEPAVADGYTTGMVALPITTGTPTCEQQIAAAVELFTMQAF